MTDQKHQINQPPAYGIKQQTSGKYKIPSPLRDIKDGDVEAGNVKKQLHKRRLLTMKDEIVLYQPNDQLSIEVKLENETVWLTQQQMATRFNTTRNNITLHIGNIFKEGELDKDSVCKESLLTAADDCRKPHGRERRHG
jgi:hypothetical protein